MHTDARKVNEIRGLTSEKHDKIEVSSIQGVVVMSSKRMVLYFDDVADKEIVEYLSRSASRRRSEQMRRLLLKGIEQDVKERGEWWKTR